MSIKIKKDLLTRNDRVYGRNNGKKYITIHETANTSRGANAAAHARLLRNGFSASWHYSVDDKEAIQSYAHSAQCWHAGDGRGDGNLNSIGIEICVNSDGNFAKAVDNAVKLVRKIMAEENIPLSNVVQHNHWSGKNCPTNLRKGGEWTKFIKAVKSGTNAKPTKHTPKPQTKPSGSSKAYTGGSIVMYLDSIGEDSSATNRARLAKEYGIKNYRRTAAQNTELLNKIRSGKKPANKSKPTPAKRSKSIAQMAKEVNEGKHGNGHVNRRKSLGVNQATYNKVRAEVNRIARGTSKPRKTVAQMAREVIAGKHGNGHTKRRRSLGVNASTYAKVRAEVNRRS